MMRFLLSASFVVATFLGQEKAFADLSDYSNSELIAELARRLDRDLQNSFGYLEGNCNFDDLRLNYTLEDSSESFVKLSNTSSVDCNKRLKEIAGKLGKNRNPALIASCNMSTMHRAITNLRTGIKKLSSKEFNTSLECDKAATELNRTP